MNSAAVFTPRALSDLRKALDWFSETSFETATDSNEVVALAARRIGRHPALGSHRPMMAGDLRFWPLRRFPYLLVYTERTRPPRILRVLHMARDLPPLLRSLPR